ncbi:MFS transporter [Sphingosinicella humi]|uniref:MFS transporter n=1 Tax=Allosphingosinicella humi TaxID=2068657 RepID=A0A2U2J445_9SPHN|nr:MFS transporter [Sphingosinicella humi]PWG03051.1 MFS transporter [Sphingosinicella humi]
MSDIPEPAAERSGSALSPFRHSIFRSVWIATLASSFGGMIQGVGAAWMMVALAASAQMVTLVQASITLPIVLLSLVAGALADAFDRRKLMIAAQVFMLVVSAMLAIAAYIDWVTPWLLLTFTFLIGCGAALNAPAWQASVGAMVPREDVPSAVTLNSMGFNLARSVGPALGGLIVAVAGAAAAFTINALSYIGLIGVLARWRPEREERLLPRERLGSAIMAGIRYVSMSPSINSTLVRGFVTGTGASAASALSPLIARDLIGGGPVTYGLLLGAFGVGAVAAALWSHRLRIAYSNELIVRFALAASALGMAICALSSSLTLTMAAMLLCGVGWVLVVSILNATVQMSAPRWVVARALSLYQMATFSGMAGGAWLWGYVTEGSGLATALLIAAAVQLGCIALGRWFRLPETEAMNLDLLGFPEPETVVPVQGRTGPVIVTIEYRIAEEDVFAFLAAMAERRQIRRRNGARRWSLLRDLSDPEIWLERYHSPTWTEYVRHNRRFTHDDAAIGERIRALHQGPGTPAVRRLIERTTGFPPDAIGPHPEEWAAPMTDQGRLS